VRMNKPTNIQTIMQDGKPAFVVIPFDEYVRMIPKTARVPEGDAIPHEVVGLTIKKGYTLAWAWREYLGLTQQEVAKRMGWERNNASMNEALYTFSEGNNSSRKGVEESNRPSSPYRLCIF
jgi:hypothetical protein